MIYVCGFKDSPISGNNLVINTTSRSTNWSKGLSPFVLGPVDLYDGYVSQNMENAWQFSKVYEQHVDDNLNPTKEYFTWAKNGWDDYVAHRYPMGKNAPKPLYSYFNGQKLTYIEARKQIYVPLYAQCVIKSSAYKQLKEISKTQDVWLWDFDGYNHKELDMTYDQVLNSESRKMGHAFVIAMLLEGYLKYD